MEKVGRMPDCYNTGQGQGWAGKTQHMSQATFLQSHYNARLLGMKAVRQLTCQQQLNAETL